MGLPIAAYVVVFGGAPQIGLVAARASILLFGLFGWAPEAGHEPADPPGKSRQNAAHR